MSPITWLFEPVAPTTTPWRNARTFYPGRVRLWQRLVLVGDRGLRTTNRIEEDLRGREGVQWKTALRAPQIRQLAADGVLQMSLFDERDLAELQHDVRYPSFGVSMMVMLRWHAAAAETPPCPLRDPLGELANLLVHERQRPLDPPCAVAIRDRICDPTESGLFNTIWGSSRPRTFSTR